jgi:hypothetical protein
LGVPELFNGEVEQLDGIRVVSDRPAGVLVALDEGREDIELVGGFGAGSGSSQFLDFSQRSGVIAIVSNRTNFHDVRSAKISKSPGDRSCYGELIYQ